MSSCTHACLVRVKSKILLDNHFCCRQTNLDGSFYNRMNKLLDSSFHSHAYTLFEMRMMLEQWNLSIGFDVWCQPSMILTVDLMVGELGRRRGRCLTSLSRSSTGAGSV